MLARWTQRQLRAFLAWLDREWETPSLTDHYLMKLMAENSLREDASPEDYRIKWDKRRPVKAKRKPKETEAERQAAQAAKDKRDSAMWRGFINTAATKRPEDRADKQ